MNGNKQKHQRKIQSPGTSFHSIFPVKVFKGTGTDPFKDHARNDQDPSTSFLLFTMLRFFKDLMFLSFLHPNTMILKGKLKILEDL